MTAARILQGVAWSRLGHWSRAVSEWRHGLMTYPLPPEAALLHYNLGLALSSIGDRHGAIAEFEQALAYRPQWAEAHYHLGVARVSTKDWAGAVIAYEKVIELRPSWAHAYFNLGKAHYQLGAVSRAIEAYEYAIRLEPDFSDAHYQLGVTFRAQGRSAEAIDPLKAAANGGLLEAQELLASMYANGSGVDRSLPIAMVWWFRAASSGSMIQPAVDARGRLSRLRRQVLQNTTHSFEGEEILAGFALIRETLRHTASNAQRYSVDESVGRQMIRKGHVAQAVPVLIQEAWALDESAQEQLERLYLHGIDARLNSYDSRIFDYFIESAMEKNPRSCTFLEKIVRRSIARSSTEIDTALQICDG